MNIRLIPAFLLLSIIAACQQQSKSDLADAGETTDHLENPAADGFNFNDSDPEAIDIADKVMSAMGGRKNWDDTRIISWNFFGRRTHTWDKLLGRDRIEIPGDSMIIDMDINTMEGRVFLAGQQVFDPDTLQKYIERGKALWINDSYWLFMPFKLKDSGVTLKYIGKEESDNGDFCHKLELTFNNVGVTPQNRYEIYVDTAKSLVCQWKYFPESTMDSAQFTIPWLDYQEYGNILLSGDRGKYQLSDIKVSDHWKE